VDLSVDAGAPFGAALDTTTLTGQDQVSANLTFTVPPNTPSGTYNARLTASDGTRVRTSVFPIRVDSVAPTIGIPGLQLRSGTQLSNGITSGTGTWPAGADAGGSIARYEVRWRTDGVLGASAAFAASAVRSTSRAMTVGHTYGLLVRTRDLAGNWSAWSESGAFRPRVSQDTSPTLKRAGGWYFERHASLSYGSTLDSSNKGASLTRTFSGRAVGLIVSRGPGRGKAQVYVDGTLAQTIDTYRSTAQYRWLSFARAWSTSGPHTIKIVVLRLPTTHPSIAVDAFVIVP
jgi:hypothetical protein